MSIFSKIFGKLFKKNKRKATPSTKQATPSLTILMAINPEVENKGECEALLKDQAKKLSFLNPTTALIDTIKDFKDYNRFCKQDLASAFDTDFVLVIQRDGKVLNPAAWDNEFFKYDYIGAPWKIAYGWISKMLTAQKKDLSNKDFLVGNGGFSLRSKKFCEEVAKNFKDSYSEDAFACVAIRDKMEAAGIKFAPYEVASKFSVENDVYSDQFGAHKTVVKNGQKVSVVEM